MTLQELINRSKNIVFFGGAGVSTASGIPDFRSSSGIYNQSFHHSPEYMLSHTFFQKETAEFYKFYRENMLYLDAKPNDAHYKLAEMEDKGKLLAIITQNIDGLHQKAGSKNVLELHGSVLRNYCQDCNVFHSIEEVTGSSSIPYCSCGGIIKPDVVLYEESLDADVLAESTKAIEKADLLIVGGTSLRVYPAANFVRMYSGSLAIVNRDATSEDYKADVIVQGDIAKKFSHLVV